MVLYRGVSLYSLKLLIKCRPYVEERKRLNEVCGEERRLLERPSRRWEDNIIKVFRKIHCEDVYKIHLP
jgi:hypothetical protein